MPRALTYQQRLAHPRITGNLSKKGPGTTAYVLEMQGANTVATEFFGIAQVFPDFAVQLLDVVADIMIDEARERVRVETGATRDSINKDPGVWNKGERGEFSIRVGPTTFYAPFLEYGTKAKGGGMRNRPYPFMIPAADAVEPTYLAAVMHFMSIISTGTLAAGVPGMAQIMDGATGFGDTGGGGRSQGIRKAITDLRTFLYTTSKFLGDVAVFGGHTQIGPARRMMMTTARALGDISASMNSTLSSRFTRRLSGRVTGRLIGFGSRTFSGGASYSAFIGGRGGHRIYQRVAGRATAIRFGSSNLPGF